MSNNKNLKKETKLQSNKINERKPEKKLGLGKGLGALIPDVDFNVDKKGFNIPITDNRKKLDKNKINISDIVTNPYQPRKKFDQAALEDLKNSILEHGVIQPISVRIVSGGYELISGERRLRASKLAGLKEIPAYVLDNVSDTQMLEIALIENVQREDLNPLEIAAGYQQLIEECNLTQEQVAIKVSKNRSTISNFLRILKLPSQIHESINDKEISMGHSRALLGLNTSEQIISTWQKILDKGLSVRATEKLVKEILTKPSANIKNESNELIISDEQKIIFNDIEDKLRQYFSTEVKIKPKSKESGIISLDYFSSDEFERIMELLTNE